MKYLYTLSLFLYSPTVVSHLPFLTSYLHSISALKNRGRRESGKEEVNEREREKGGGGKGRRELEIEMEGVL